MEIQTIGFMILIRKASTHFFNCVIRTQYFYFTGFEIVVNKNVSNFSIVLCMNSLCTSRMGTNCTMSRVATRPALLSNRFPLSASRICQVCQVLGERDSTNYITTSTEIIFIREKDNTNFMIKEKSYLHL